MVNNLAKEENENDKGHEFTIGVFSLHFITKQSVIYQKYF